MFKPNGLETTQLGHNRVASALVCISLAVSGGLLISKAFDKEPGVGPKPVPVTQNESQPLLFDDEASASQAIQSMQDDLDYNGEGTAIFKPTQESRDYFNSRYLNDHGLPSENPPKLREVIYANDKSVFSADELKKPYVFNIFNGSNRPVDISFVRFALKGAKSWLDSRPKGQVTIHNKVVAKVKQNRGEHTFLFTDEVMKQVQARTQKGIKGVTTPWPGRFVSYVSASDEHTPKPPGWRAFNFDKPALFYRYDAMATEICQSLITVSDPRVFSGVRALSKLSSATTLLRQDNDLKGSGKTDSFTLRNQEVVCNGLGDILTATYLAGKKDPRF
jgi:hypothetical protein